VSVGREARCLPRYIEHRRTWLQSLPEPLSATVYRRDTFTRLIGSNNWGLALPIDVHGVTIPSGISLPRAA
jgi:hypothetical protein